MFFMFMLSYIPVMGIQVIMIEILKCFSPCSLSSAACFEAGFTLFGVLLTESFVTTETVKYLPRYHGVHCDPDPDVNI